MVIVVDICLKIFNDAIFDQWSHIETKKLAKLGESLIHKHIEFESLKTFRSYIKHCCKNVPQLIFVDEMDIDFRFDTN